MDHTPLSTIVIVRTIVTTNLEVMSATEAILKTVSEDVTTTTTRALKGTTINVTMVTTETTFLIRMPFDRRQKLRAFR